MNAPSEPTEASPPEAETHTARSHHVVARILTVVGVLLLVVSVLANFVKREALDQSHLRTTSKRALLDARRPALRERGRQERPHREAPIGPERTGWSDRRRGGGGSAARRPASHTPA